MDNISPELKSEHEERQFKFLIGFLLGLVFSFTFFSGYLVFKMLNS